MTTKRELIKKGAAEVRLYFARPGRFCLRWKEGGVWRATNRQGGVEEGRRVAREIARRVARELAGEVVVSPGELALLERLREVAGSNPWQWLERAAEMMGRGGVEPVTLGEAYDRFYARYLGAPVRTSETVRTRLGQFVRGRRDLIVAEITAEDLAGWIDCDNATTFNNRRKEWVGFCNWSKKEGYLAEAGLSFAERVERRRERKELPGILTVEQGRDLWRRVQRDAPELTPFLLLAGFMGLRVSECKRVKWGDLSFDEGALYVRPEVAGKTLGARWVLIPEGAAGLFSKFFEQSGGVEEKRICKTRDDRELRELAKTVVSEWPVNALRHSFVTYRLQVVGSVGKVAEEAGNSERVLRRDYRRPVRAGEGIAWFAIVGGAG